MKRGVQFGNLALGKSLTMKNYCELGKGMRNIEANKVFSIDKILGSLLVPLKLLEGDTGGVRHAMKKGDIGYKDFGEAYFSQVPQG